MVNLLTVAVNTKVDYEGMGSVNSAAIRNVLTGAPDDKNARPITDKITIGKDFLTSLPAYSFTVIRIKSE